jgi:hypothetical protein
MELFGAVKDLSLVPPMFYFESRFIFISTFYLPKDLTLPTEKVLVLIVTPLLETGLKPTAVPLAA